MQGVVGDVLHELGVLALALKAGTAEPALVGRVADACEALTLTPMDEADAVLRQLGPRGFCVVRVVACASVNSTTNPLPRVL